LIFSAVVLLIAGPQSKIAGVELRMYKFDACTLGQSSVCPVAPQVFLALEPCPVVYFRFTPGEEIQSLLLYRRIIEEDTERGTTSDTASRFCISEGKYMHVFFRKLRSSCVVEFEEHVVSDDGATHQNGEVHSESMIEGKVEAQSLAQQLQLSPVDNDGKSELDERDYHETSDNILRSFTISDVDAFLWALKYLGALAYSIEQATAEHVTCGCGNTTTVWVSSTLPPSP